MPRSPSPAGSAGMQRSRFGRLVPAAIAALLALGVVGSLALYWYWVAPGRQPFSVPGLVLALLAVAVCQACRAVLLDDWLRRLAVLAVPVGVAVAFLGLQPDAACVVLVAEACGVAAPSPNLALLGVGVLATAVAVYLDLRRRSVAREPDPIA